MSIPCYSILSYFGDTVIFFYFSGRRDLELIELAAGILELSRGPRSWFLPSPEPGTPMPSISVPVSPYILYPIFLTEVRVVTWSYLLGIRDLEEEFLPTPYTDFSRFPIVGSWISFAFAFNFWAFSGLSGIEPGGRACLITGTLVGPSFSLLNHAPFFRLISFPSSCVVERVTKAFSFRGKWNMCCWSLFSMAFREILLEMVRASILSSPTVF